jgi:5-methyltetrahydrofolate--homocysteine methyltransferase
MPPFLDVLRSGRVLLMDGAMGTELQKVGLGPGENTAAWNFLYPEKVRAVHQTYLSAGAEVLLTNTFLHGCDSFKATLESAGHAAPDWGKKWRQAYELTGSTIAYRLAAIGPAAGPPGGREFDRLIRVFVPHWGRDLADTHTPDAILLETCSTPRVRYALAHLRIQAPLRLLLSLTYRSAGGKLVTSSGHPPEWFARRAKTYGVAALGVNCGQNIGLDEIIEIVRRYRQETDLPLFARPNAGTPTRVGDRWSYPLTPEEMAGRLPELLEAGVCMVGGCCGTTPAHIAACRPVVDAWNRRKKTDFTAENAESAEKKEERRQKE